MKKSFLSLVALCAMTLNLQAQQSAKGAPVSDKVEEAAITTLLQSINDRIDAMMTHVTEMENTYSQNFPDKNGIITHGHEYVDLGIVYYGLKYYWATCNIGAETPEDYGLYFAWGETQGYGQDVSDGHVFDWANYKWCEGTSTTITKYRSVNANGFVDSKIQLDAEDDAAHQNWGGSWRMPARFELLLLVSQCTWEWEPERGGYIGTSKNNGNTIFLPAAGYRSGSHLSRDGLVGFYWSKSADYDDGTCASNLNFDWNIDLHMSSDDRSIGRSIRPVICLPDD